MMAGRIWVESVPRQGSVFHFTLDLALAAETEIPISGQREPGKDALQIQPPLSSTLDAFTGRGVRVLLVEDNAVNRTLAQRLLQKRDFAVSVANDGKQAIAATRNAEFDLILMDIQMPEMDGFEATAAIREREKLTGRRTPIIALTAHALKEDRERCLSAGMDAYVTKPIRPAELFKVIQNLLQSSATGDASTLLTPVPSSR
jgi:CheY-like chemotaxis protein